jgi:hypothetical protein
MYAGVEGGVVNGDHRGEPWRWAGLWEDWMCCGGDALLTRVMVHGCIDTQGHKFMDTLIKQGTNSRTH